MAKLVTVEQKERVAIVRFDSGHPANALSYEVMAELLKVARSFEGDTHLNAVILAGRQDNFSYGIDLKDRKLRQADKLGLAEKRELLAIGPRLCAAWETVEPLTIAAIEGWCVGGGVALATALDLRVCAEDGHFYAPEIERGMNMSWGSVPRIVNLIGPSRAKRLVTLAEKIPASEAENWGLADYIVPSGHVLDKAMHIAERAANLPPVGVRMTKQGISQAANALNRATSFMDIDQFTLTRSSKDYREAVQAFIDKRPAKFTGK